MNLAIIVLAAISCLHADNFPGPTGRKMIICQTDAASVTPVKATVENVARNRSCNPWNYTEIPTGLAVVCNLTTDTVGPIDDTLWTAMQGCTGIFDYVDGLVIDHFVYRNQAQRNIELARDIVTGIVSITMTSGTVPMQLHVGTDPWEVGIHLPATFLDSVGEITKPGGGCIFTLIPPVGDMIYFNLR